MANWLYSSAFDQHRCQEFVGSIVPQNKILEGIRGNQLQKKYLLYEDTPSSNHIVSSKTWTKQKCRLEKKVIWFSDLSVIMMIYCWGLRTSDEDLGIQLSCG